MGHETEKKKNKTSTSSSKPEQRSKFVYPTLGIAIIGLLASYYFTNNAVTEETAGIVIKFNENLDDNWIRELYDYIETNINKPTIRLDNKTYTPTLGHCHATCYDEKDNTQIYFDEKCRTQPLFLYDRIVTEELQSRMTYAEATMPCFLKLAQSKIPDANRGIFTTKYKIPKGLVFGPYFGVKRSAYGEEGQDARDGGYSWRVNRYDEDYADFYIDGVNETTSNWMRYVNSARYEEEQNVFPLLFNDTVYYITFKDIEPETELLVWYGYKYAKWLEIFVIPSSKHDWDTDFAPPVKETICRSCPVTEGETRKEEDDEDEYEEEEQPQCRMPDDGDEDEEEAEGSGETNDDDLDTTPTVGSEKKENVEGGKSQHNVNNIPSTNDLPPPPPKQKQQEKEETKKS